MRLRELKGNGQKGPIEFIIIGYEFRACVIIFSSYINAQFFSYGIFWAYGQIAFKIQW